MLLRILAFFAFLLVAFAQSIPFPGPGGVAGPAPSAISFVGAAGLGDNGGAGTFTHAYTAGSGTNEVLLISITADFVNDDLTGVTYNGSSATFVAKNLLGNRFIYLYCLAAPTSGSHNIVVTSTNSHMISVTAADYAHVDQSCTPNASTTNQSIGVASTLTTTLTTGTDNSWTFMVGGGYDGGVAPSAGTGATQRATDGSSNINSFYDSNSAIHPAGSYSMTFTYPVAANTMASIMVAYAPQ